MKKILIAMLMLLGSTGAWAQKFALVDMEYILKNIPAYERASDAGIIFASPKIDISNEVLTKLGYN